MGNKAELVESGGEAEVVLTGFEPQLVGSDSKVEVVLVGDKANVYIQIAVDEVLCGCLHCLFSTCR